MSHEHPLDAAAALAAMAAYVPGARLLVATGQYSPHPSVAERVGVFALDGPPSLLLDEWIVPTGIPRLIERLAARRGEWDVMFATAWERTWTVDGAPFTLWDRKGGVLWQDEDMLRFRDRPPLAVPLIRSVHVFVDAGWGRRGVRLERAQGRPLPVARTFEPMAALDPTYGEFDLVCDASWAVSLARSLASAIGVPVKLDPPL